MDRVFRIDEQLACLKKPPMESADQFVLKAQDCLVVSAGFEDRALAVLQNAVANSERFNVLIIEYRPFVPENKLDQITSFCQDSRLNVANLIYDRQNPAGFGDQFIDKLSGISGRLLIDISAMSRLLIVQCLVALRRRPAGLAGCIVCFAQAQTYPPTQEEVEAAIRQMDVDPLYAVLFLSSGVFNVTIVPELSAPSLGANQSRLVVFPSFNPDQLTALRAELQPSRFAFINGVPPSAHNQWRLDAIASLNHLAGLANHEVRNTSTLDYRETLTYLIELYEKYGVRERLLISPTGSKMQTVAVALAKAFIEDLQIVYPTPREFRSPKTYTAGIGQMHILPLEIFSQIDGHAD